MPRVDHISRRHMPRVDQTKAAAGAHRARVLAEAVVSAYIHELAWRPVGVS